MSRRVRPREPGSGSRAISIRSSVAFLRELPQAVSLEGVLDCHGSPRDDDEILTRVSSDERFRAALEGVQERLVVGGHTHVQFERVVDGIRFVNAGSVGIPYEGKQGAFWVLLDAEVVDFRHTPYAVDAAVAAIRTQRLPGRGPDRGLAPRAGGS